MCLQATMPSRCSACICQSLLDMYLLSSICCSALLFCFNSRSCCFSSTSFVFVAVEFLYSIFSSIWLVTELRLRQRRRFNPYKVQNFYFQTSRAPAIVLTTTLKDDNDNGGRHTANSHKL